MALTPILGLDKTPDNTYNWGAAYRSNLDKLEAAVAPEHNTNGTHKAISTPSISLGGVPRSTWPTPGTATQALTDTLLNGPIGNIPAGQEFAVQNSTGTKKHFAVDEVTGKVTAINLAGMLGNISSPLVDIPFKRANDAKALSGVQSFTRASTGTYVDPLDGLVKTALADTPRFERMSDGGTGILMEGASTNLALNSSNMSELNWNVFNLLSGVTTSNTTDTIFQTSGYTTVTLQAAAGLSSELSMIVANVLPNTTYTVSVFVEKTSAANASELFLSYNYGSGQALTTFFDTFTGLFNTTSPASSALAVDHVSYWRVYITGTTAASLVAGGWGLRIGQSNSVNRPTDGIRTLRVGLPQLEELPFATSYIPTTTAPVTRAGDLLNIPTSGNFMATLDDSFSIIVDFDILGSLAFTSSQYILDTSSTSRAVNMIANWAGSNSFHTNLTAGGGYYVAPAPTAISTVIRACSILKNSGTELVYMDGVNVFNNPNITKPTSISPNPTIQIGNYINSNNLYGHIRNFRIYDRALTTSEVEAA